MRTVLSAALLAFAAFAACAAGNARAAEPAPAAPQTTLRSPLMWEIRDGTHPKMGPITVALPSSSIVTPVGKEKIQTLVYVSCERTRGRVAIEIANAADSDPRGGLMPARMPKLTCNPRAEGPATEIAASWYVSELGDALARGLAPAELRRCASIEVSEELALPRGWEASAQRIDIEVIPYKKELDTVLGSCVEGAYIATAPAPAPVRPAAPAAKAAAPAPTPSPAKAPAAVMLQAATSEAPWKSARTVSQGRTNVRASPKIDAPIVTQLYPGMPVLAQRAGGEWLKVKPRSGAAFGGWIREDRLVFE